MGFQAEMLSTSRYKSLLKTSDIHHHDTETDRSSQGAHLIQQNLVAQQYDTCPKHNFRSQNRGNPQCQSNPTPPLTPYSKSILTAQFTHPFSAPLQTPRRHARTPEAKRRTPEAGRPPLAKTAAPRPGRATGQSQWPARASNERRGGTGLDLDGATGKRGGSGYLRARTAIRRGCSRRRSGGGRRLVCCGSGGSRWSTAVGAGATA
jgi:hypothetical protein